MIMGALSEKLFSEYVDYTLPGDEGDGIRQFKERIDAYSITDCWFSEDHLFILTYRPGIVIGVKGKEIHYLESLIREIIKEENFNIKFEGIKLKEDRDPLINYLYRGWHNWQFRYDY
jgi:hypothetical protein